MSYTESERIQHYDYLIDTIQFLSNNNRITEDWMEEHKKAIMNYRKVWMDNLGYMNPEITDSEFRLMCQEAELLLSKLVNSIIKKGTFDTKSYLLFCEKIKFMVNFVCEYYPETSLEKLLSEMSI